LASHRRKPAILSICIVLALFAISTFSLPLVFGFTNGESAAAQVGEPNLTTGGCDYPKQPYSTDTNLCYPYGAAFDPSGNLWVADTSNARVVEFPLSGGVIQSTESSVIGQTSFSGFSCDAGGVSASKLCHAWGVAFDKPGNLWVADTENNRILEFPLVSGVIQSTATEVIGQTSPSAFGCNEFSFSSLSTLCQPEGLAFDSSGNLWVTDFDNSRVMEFPLVSGSISKTATTLIGQTSAAAGSGSAVCNEGSAAPTDSTLCGPSTLAFDTAGNLWVADQDNNRVLEFPLVSGVIQSTATGVIGQSGFTGDKPNEGATGGYPPTASTLYSPYGVAFDPEGNLWVGDTDNARVLEFPLVSGAIQTAATTVLGQTTFSGHNGNAGQGSTVAYGMAAPNTVTFDPSGNLWVSDFSNSRILEFTGPSIGAPCIAVTVPPPTDGTTATAEDSCTGTPTGGSLTAGATGTGITVAITGASATGTVTITASDLSGAPSASHGGADTALTGASYYDVSVSAETGGMAQVCISPANGATAMQYFYGGTWVSATGITTPDNSICGTIPVYALGGTPIAIGTPAGPKTGVPEFSLGTASGFMVLAVLLPVLLVIGRTRRTNLDAQ